MTWDKLLSNLRCPKTDSDPLVLSQSDPFRSHFEADVDRIIFSAPFRRLARKTQVHPLSLNDQVHTRLTHSLEVANVGRSLGHRLAAFLQKTDQLPISPHDLLAIIQAACLAHDIGNPPFGHAGEHAIREWVKMHPAEVFGPNPSAFSPALRNDLEIFEGNAQSFRLSARADNPQAAYLRLTVATLGAMIKYPWDSSDPRALAKQKYNVFSTEKKLFDTISAHLGTKQPDGTVARHPLSFLTEAADDICYRILDLEDAAEIGIVTQKKVRDVYLALAGPSLEAAPIPVLRGKAIQTLIDRIWEVFEKNYHPIMNGDRTKDLKSDLDPSSTAALQSIATLYTEIFAERSKVAAELGAYKALGRIVKALSFAIHNLTQTADLASTGFLAKRCFELAWGEPYARLHEKEPAHWWLHQTLDFVSGLSDNYARQLSREIEGT